MRPFDYHAPTSLNDVVALLRQHGPHASVLAGGTDLLVEIKEALRRPQHVVNLKRVPGLDRLGHDAERGLHIGALVRVRDLETSADVQRHYAGLWQAARELGSIQVRCRATLAGNVCRASPSADTLPPLIADGALVHTRSADGERRIPAEDFFTGPGRTVLSPDEVVTGFTLPAPAPRSGKAYLKHGRRKAMELATVGVAVSLALADDGSVDDLRIVLGAVAPTPIRARRAEDQMRGERLISPGLLEVVARTAMAESSPISDVRASAEYRRRMVGVLTRRAIELALQRAAEPAR
ncbi:xanthine dehydrogenase family protein subunit M [Calidifontimicrobium sp. SYSU G02091]|uniref:FAD binding domain-containing protein n=1 Tax=Calidifontimicrobium sp. SYSU G02091 TaxID=2926421 RepID=UPI001F53CEFB|nr:xanthine dehydrogenase family protein subunit M [Calidifontimicrobium sp. SYSU G02091]MCI1192415.1 xanthine dehydrogenase family protein subunit M [Calidifontimicrobium sp. SYSU G02091]